MQTPPWLRKLAASALCLLLLGCASADPVAYSGLDSASRLRANPDDETGSTPYAYSTSTDWSAYSTAYIEPVEIYQGPDDQFDELDPEDRASLAAYMRTTFSEALESRFKLTSAPAPGGLRIRPILTGAVANTPVLSTLSRFDPGGALYNGVQSIRGGEGLFTGAVYYAVEVYDVDSGRLLSAFVSKRHPGAYDLTAGVRTLGAARTGLDEGAEQLRDSLS